MKIICIYFYKKYKNIYFKYIKNSLKIRLVFTIVIIGSKIDINKDRLINKTDGKLREFIIDVFFSKNLLNLNDFRSQNSYFCFFK